MTRRMPLPYRGPDAYFGPAPVLLVVVDTEEEFNWSAPFDRESRSVSSIAANGRAQEIFDRFGVRPTYCVDQCVAEDQAAVAFLGRLMRENRCQIGAHLHPWVTPPYDEEVNAVNSFHGNLPAPLEKSKIRTLTDTIEHAFGARPRIFKAGRYGIGPNTVELLQDAGYVIDCSFVPHTSFRAEGGPSFIGLPDQPFWIGDARRFLEVPLTKGFSGLLAGLFPPSLAGLFDAGWASRLKVAGILSRLNIIERATLSPEGMTIAEQTRLIRSMVARGKKVFSLTYHSSSLAPGHTPYVRDERDLAVFLRRIETILTLFRDDIGGTFTTLDEVREEALNASD